MASEDPMRPTLRSAKAEATCTKSHTDSEAASRTNDLRAIDAPKCAYPNTDNELPNRVIPNTDKEEAKRATALSDIDAPQCANPSTANEAPMRANLRKAMDDPMCAHPKTATEEPTLATARIDSDAPQ